MASLNLRFYQVQTTTIDNRQHRKTCRNDFRFYQVQRLGFAGFKCQVCISIFMNRLQNYDHISHVHTFDFFIYLDMLQHQKYAVAA